MTSCRRTGNPSAEPSSAAPSERRSVARSNTRPLACTARTRSSPGPVDHEDVVEVSGQFVGPLELVSYRAVLSGESCDRRLKRSRMRAPRKNAKLRNSVSIRGPQLWARHASSAPLRNDVQRNKLVVRCQYTTQWRAERFENFPGNRSARLVPRHRSAPRLSSAPCCRKRSHGFSPSSRPRPPARSRGPDSASIVISTALSSRARRALSPRSSRASAPAAPLRLPQSRRRADVYAHEHFCARARRTSRRRARRRRRAAEVEHARRRAPAPAGARRVGATWASSALAHAQPQVALSSAPPNHDEAERRPCGWAGAVDLDAIDGQPRLRRSARQGACRRLPTQWKAARAVSTSRRRRPARVDIPDGRAIWRTSASRA